VFLVVVCPILAAAGLILGLSNRRLGLAASLVSVQPIVFILSVLSFSVGGMMYGF
jgi:hypothetical protein